MAFMTGPRTTYENVLDHRETLRNGLDYLSPKQDGIALLKKIGTNGFTVDNHVFSWTETDLAPRSEDVTLADGAATSLTVVDTGIYQVNDLISIEDEIVRVDALASGTVLTIERGYAGTTGAAHADVGARILGSADPENAQAPASQTDVPRKLFNYVQTFTRAVEMSNDEIGTASTDGNPLTGNLRRRFVEINRQLATALFYGIASEDDTGKVRTMGGLMNFLQTNITAVGGALTIAAIDGMIKDIIDAGGMPTVIVVGTTQKQKLDALDSNLIRTGKATRVGGGSISTTWQSGVMDDTLELIVDHSIRPDELWILDTNDISVGHMSHNGVNGAFSVEDATTPGQDGQKKVIRGKYTTRVNQEKGHGLLTGLTTA